MAASDDQTFLEKLAEEFFGLKDAEKEAFVNEGMKRRGHKLVSSWADSSESGEGKKEGGFFSGGSTDWQYGKK